MDISCAFPPTVDTPDLVAYAEELGYKRAWIYDTPALQLDVWMTLALAAQRTSTIGLGPGALRHLEIHRGHLTELNAHDRLTLTGSVAAAISRSGNAAHTRDRLAASAAAGATEVAFQPAGDDLRAELRSFMAAARGED